MKNTFKRILTNIAYLFFLIIKDFPELVLITYKILGKFLLFLISFFYSHPRTFFSLLFRERGREREKYPRDRETLIGCLPYGPGQGIKHTAFRL